MSTYGTPGLTQGAVLVVGDVMLDREIKCEMNRISPEFPAPILREKEIVETPGGAGNVARNIVSLGGEAYLMGVIGGDREGDLIKEYALPGLHVYFPVAADGRTATKTRFTVDGEWLLRYDREDGNLVAEDRMINAIREVLAEGTQIKVVVIADYNKGAMTRNVVDNIRYLAQLRNIPVLVDCRPATFRMYSHVTLIKPNWQEAMGMMDYLGDVHPGLAESNDLFTKTTVACSVLRKALSCQSVVVTAGAEGCVYFDPADQQIHSAGAAAQHVYDVCGAGDTVMAALAVQLLEGQTSLSIAVQFAMQAAGLAVREHGVVAVERDAVEESMYQSVGWAAKGMGWEQFWRFVARRKRAGHRIVFANGCFDGLHAGHVEMLRWAAQKGETLVVCYNDDESLRQLKGTSRPRVPDSYRMSHLSQLACVDAVCRFNGDVMQVLRTIQPDFFIKGEDSGPVANVPGADYVARMGGEVLLAPVLFNFSSSRL